MALTDTLRRLATGEAAIKDCLGLFISPEGFCLCEASTKGGKLVVGNLARVAAPPGGATARLGTLNTELLEKIDPITDGLRAALSNGRWSSKNLVVSLSPHFGLTRYFLMPEVPRQFQKQSVPLEAKKYIPFPFAELMYDFQVLPMPPSPDNKSRMGVLFGITPQKNVESLRAIAGKLGRRLVAVELSSLSTSRLWHGTLPRPGDGAAQAEVHFDARATYVVVHRGGVPFLSREVYWAAGAELDKRRIDVAGCVDFARKQLGVQGLKLRVMGSGNLAAWRKTYEEDFAMPVEELDLAAALAPGLDWPAQAAMGASLRHLLPEAARLDLSHSSRDAQEDARVIVSLYLASGALSLLLAGLGGVSGAQLWYTHGQIEAAARESGEIKAFQGKTAEDIETFVEGLKSQVLGFGSILDARVYATDVMAWIVDSIPESVWLTDVAYQNKLGAAAPGSAPGARLALSGYASAQDPATELQLVNSFRDALKKDPRYARYFNNIEVTFDRAAAGSPSERTRFTLSCMRKLGAK